MLNEGACQITKMFKCSIINSSTDKSARQNDLIANLKRYLPIQIFRYIYVCQWLWLGSQQPSAEFNCSLPPGPGPVSTAQILCQQSLFVECGLGIRRYVAAGAPPNITTLGFTPSNSEDSKHGFFVAHDIARTPRIFNIKITQKLYYI